MRLFGWLKRKKGLRGKGSLPVKARRQLQAHVKHKRKLIGIIGKR